MRTERVRVLLVNLASLGDVVQAMPVVHDIRAAHPLAHVDWVVPAPLVPLVRRVDGVHDVFACAAPRWRVGAGWRQARAERRALRSALKAQAYDAIIDLQGRLRSTWTARLASGPRYTPAHRADGSSRASPARWLAHHAIAVTPRCHLLDRARELAATALHYRVDGAPVFGLRTGGERASLPTLVLAHGSARDEHLWPEENWIEFGQRCASAGYDIALPRGGKTEADRAERIARAIGPQARVWPVLALDDLADRMQGTQGVIGVDSGISQLAVALNLPHVQLFNAPTAWHTGPRREHGHRQQVALERQPTPEVDLVWAAWQVVRRAGRA